LKTEPFEYQAVDKRGYDSQKNLIPVEPAKRLLDRLVAVPDITLKVFRVFAIHHAKFSTPLLGWSTSHADQSNTMLSRRIYSELI
jgi:hypothetical protein